MEHVPQWANCFVKFVITLVMTTPDEYIRGLDERSLLHNKPQAAARLSTEAPTHPGCDITCHVITAIQPTPASINKLTVKLCFSQAPVDIVVNIAHPLLQLLCTASRWCISPVVNKQTLLSNGSCHSHVIVHRKSGTVHIYWQGTHRTISWKWNAHSPHG